MNDKIEPMELKIYCYHCGRDQERNTNIAFYKGKPFCNELHCLNNAVNCLTGEFYEDKPSRERDMKYPHCDICGRYEFPIYAKDPSAGGDNICEDCFKPENVHKVKGYLVDLWGALDSQSNNIRW